MSTLGLDIGTTGCKAVVFDERGGQRAKAYREYPVRMPEADRAELDPRAVCEACFAVVAEAAGACGDDPVHALSVSSQGEAFAPVAADGRVLGPAMVSSDARAKAQVQRLRQTLGDAYLYETTGHTPAPLFTLFKLAWIRDHQPELYREADRFLCFEDLFARQLGLPPMLGYSLAGRTMLFDVRRHRWDPDILAALDLSPDRLGQPVVSGTVVGMLADDVAARLNLARGAALVVGGHDQPCGGLGAGAIGPGLAMYGLGTVECICPAFDQPRFSDELRDGNLCTYDHTAGGLYTTVAYSVTGGNLLQWYRDQFAQPEVAEARRSGRSAYDHILAAMSAAPTPVLVLPYFTPSGTPYFDTQTPGAILNLRLSTTRGEVLRGLLEGVTLEMRLNLSILDGAGVVIDELRTIGGGSRSDALMQLKADVLNRPITRVEISEAGCLGVAMLARAALDQRDPRELAPEWVRPGRVFTPNPDTADHYDRKFEDYRRLQPMLSRFAAESAMV